MKLTGEDARAVVCEDHEDWSIVVDEQIINHGRWSLICEIIARHKPSNRCYRFNFSRGATEQQDEQPFEYEDSVEVPEVKLVERVVKVWEEV